MTSRYEMIEEVASLTLNLKIESGKDLIAKDRSMLGKRTTSDAYVKVFLGGKCYGHNTKVIDKNLNPVWNASFKILLSGKEARDTLKHPYPLRLVIYDEDELTADDIMGVVDVPIFLHQAKQGKYAYEADGDSTWYKIETGEKEAAPEEEGIPHHYCHNAKGKIKAQLSFSFKTKKMIFG